MIKKSLSLLLCIVMIFSCFVCVAQAEGDRDKMEETVKSIFYVSSSPAQNGFITYTISITANQKNIAGAALLVRYDSTVLQPVGCGPVKSTSGDTGTTNNFVGEFIHGNVKGDNNAYSIAYMNTNAVSTDSKSKAFFEMTFQIVDPERPKTDVSFYCREYYSTGEAEKNISANDNPIEIRTYSDVLTLEAPVAKTITAVDNGFKLVWNPVIGASGYIIYRSSPSEGKEAVGQVEGKNASSYTDTKNLGSGVTYTYTITAVNNSGSESADSNGLSSKFIAKPVISSLENAVGGVAITWTKTTGADKYNVMRRSEGTNWQLVASRVSSLDTYHKDTTVKDGVEYEYDVNSVAGKFESATATVGKKIVYVSAPELKSLSNVRDGVEIKWNAHTRAAYYVIYRREISSQAKLEWYTETNNTSFLDTAVKSGETYTYSISVVTADGRESAYSTTGHNITCVASTTVTGLTTDKSAVIVEWQSVENVDGYAIYRKSAAATDWTPVTVVKNNVNSYRDTGAASGAQYYYAVCPVKNESQGAKVASSLVYFIKAPTNVVATNENQGIRVSWDKITGAASYLISKTDGQGNTAYLGNVNTNFYVDKDVVNGSKYTYTVIAMNSLGESKVSDVSNTLYRWNEEVPAMPQLAVGGIKVTWAKKSFAQSYVLYRGVNNVWTPIAQTKEPTYLDKDVVNNTTYSYAVALVIDGSESTLFKPAKPQIKYVAPATDLVITNANRYICLTWAEMEGAQKYYVYKADTLNGEYKLIATTDANNRKIYDKDVDPGKVAYYSVKTDNGEVVSVLAPGKRNVYLDYPQLTSVVNEYTGQKITWKAVTGATAYRVYRKVYGAKYYTYVATVDGNTLSYTDSGAVNGKMMCYTVRAANENSLSAYQGKCMTYVKAPTVAISNSPNGVYLKWDKIEYAAGYNVYRKVAGAKNWSKIAYVNTLYYTDKNVKSGTNYIYTVKAYTGKVLSGCNMDGWKLMHLSTPVLYSQANGYGAITTFWRAIPGAKSYNVYRKADDEVNWTLIGTTTSTLYRDANVKSLSTYTYTVRAVNGKEISSFNYAGRTMKYLTAPTIQISNSTTGVYLQWDRIKGASSYYLYRKAGNAKNWTKIATLTSNSYLDTKVKSGTAYTYTIRAYGSKTLSGCNSYGWKTVYLNTPELVSALSYPGGIQLKWKKVPVATWYAVFRKAEGDKSWTLIGNTQGNANVTFADKTAKAGVKYTYTVRACYGNYKSWFKPGITCRANY